MKAKIGEIEVEGTPEEMIRLGLFQKDQPIHKPYYKRLERTRHFWTEEELQFLKEKVESGMLLSEVAREITEKFGFRATSDSVRTRYHANFKTASEKRERRIVKHMPWTPEEDVIMRKHYSEGGWKKVTAEMLKETGKRRSRAAITYRATQVLKLKRHNWAGLEG